MGVGSDARSDERETSVDLRREEELTGARGWGRSTSELRRWRWCDALWWKREAVARAEVASSSGGLRAPRRVELVGGYYGSRGEIGWRGVFRAERGRFEMSMMGEMEFFLGFEIKQLRGGTFINQAKYLQDMLKRFKMAELKGVATPMVTKCHLALDPNGKEVDQKSSRRKTTEVRGYKAMDSVLTPAIRLKRRCQCPKDRGIAGREICNCIGEFIYKGVYEPMKNRPDRCWTLRRLDHFEAMGSGRVGLPDHGPM
ncbi:hypothetical protein QYE76_008307 [Lolium multiflorum]|uniref:Reverse transcriptase Ty1/copia-type domain-containing protein n=1 Tax=Lolium multiflorum TaxID=4521 RepID=A0AAD8PNM3_LOLMU|nr:hypothetical protein QYE76_008307 [Lolium multiflorum]